MPRKQEVSVTMVFENGAYRVVDTLEFTKLLAGKRVVFEKVVADKGIMAHLYRSVA